MTSQVPLFNVPAAPNVDIRDDSGSDEDEKEERPCPLDGLKSVMMESDGAVEDERRTRATGYVYTNLDLRLETVINGY